MDDEFLSLQNSFFEDNCEEFDDSVEENKLVYTEIFKNYSSLVEEFIERKLKECMGEFNMAGFLEILK